MMKRVMQFTLPVVLVLFFGCGHAQTPEVSSVAGTSWAGRDSKNHDYVYHFKTNGELHYKSHTGFYKNGTWKQNNNQIYMETNDKYSEYQGTIIGNRMQGKAWNTAGKKWTWQATKK